MIISSIPPGGKFVPVEAPLRELSNSDFSYFNHIAKNLREYYEDGTIRERVLELKLPLEAIDSFSDRELDCFLRDIGFITSAYWWIPARPPTNVIVASLAIPHYWAAKRYGKKPILSYFHYSTTNCWNIFNGRPFSLDSYHLDRAFTYTLDEEWFIAIHRAIDDQENLFYMCECACGMINNNAEFVASSLEKHARTTNIMYKILCRMEEHCDPDIYFQRVRRPIMYFDNPTYEGVPEPDNKPSFVRGETGAQSMGTPARVAFLGIKHSQTGLTDHLTEMRQYMPLKHLAFIDALEQAPSVREFVLKRKTNSVLRGAYNFAVEELHRFRVEHLKLAKEYVFDKYVSYGQPNRGGTGGTMLEWLQLLCDETIEHVIS